MAVRISKVCVSLGVRAGDGRVRAARQVLGPRAVGERAARGAARLLRGRRARRAARARRAPRAARPGRAAPRHRQADQLQVLLLVSYILLITFWFAFVFTNIVDVREITIAVISISCT